MGTTARQARGMLKLPPIPEFSADNSSHQDGEAYEQWLRELAKHAELQRWSEREKLLQFELHLAGKAESVYEVLPAELKGSYASATRSLGERLQPVRREALTSGQLLRRRQRLGESVNEYVHDFEHLLEKSYSHCAGLDQGFKEVLKRDLFVQGLLLKRQEKVLPSAKTFADALYQARTVEEQQLLEMHWKEAPTSRSQPPKDLSMVVAPKGSVERQEDTSSSGKLPSAGRGQDKSRVQCYRCHGFGHLSQNCPLKRPSSEATGASTSQRSNPARSSAIRADSSEPLHDRCQRLQQQWVKAEFQRLSCAYTPEGEVDTVKGALGPLYYATVSVSGMPVEALSTPGLRHPSCRSNCSRRWGGELAYRGVHSSGLM